MKLISYLIILTLYIATSDTFVYKTNRKNHVLSFLKRSRNDQNPQINNINRDSNDYDNKKPNIFEQAKKGLSAKRENALNKLKNTAYDDTNNNGKMNYALDPVLNFLKRRTDTRRYAHYKTEASSSSSAELQNWKDEWKEHWVQKKLEAINSTHHKGDVVNMVAARPWGVPCGDPNQHDMPWGSCMLPMECESEYRIYRGDYFCGRTQFVCCSLQLTNYDMYQGFDVSFDDSQLSTDSEEKRNRGKGSKEQKRKKKARDRKNRKRDRLRRKRKIKKNIAKIIREIRKILNRSYRNGTTARKKKTKELKKFIKELKKQYKLDRHSVKDIHQMDMIKLDAELMKRLNEIREVNQEFIKNSTFKDIVLKGKMTLRGAKMLLQAYPDLESYFKDKTRRTLDDKDELDYDIEYGMLYY